MFCIVIISFLRLLINKILQILYFKIQNSSQTDDFQRMIFMQSLQRNKQQSKKHRIFYLHHQILKHYSVPNKLYGALLILQLLQMIYYGIHTTYPQLWPIKITTTIQQVLHYFELSGLWQAIGDGALLIYLLLMFFAYLANVGFILYQIYKKDYKSNQPNMIAFKYISYVAVFTKTVLFIPTVRACTTFVMANSQNYPITISQRLYGAIATLSIPTIILLFINTIDFTIFVRQNNPFKSLPFTSSVTQCQQIRTLIKLSMGLYGAFIFQPSSIGKIYCIALFTASLFYLSKIYNSPPMLKSPYNILIDLAPCLLIWMTISSLFQQFIYPGEQIGLLFMFCGIFIVPFVWLEIKQRYRSQIMYSNYKFITSPEQLLYYNYQCLNCVNNLHQVRNLIYLQGILNYHISQCKKAPQTCVCSKIRQSMSKFNLQGQKSEIAEQKQLWFKFIKYNLTQIKQKYRNVPQISLLLAYIQRDQLNNKFKALHNLQQPSNFNSGLKIQFLSYHYLRQIQERMFNEDRLANQKKTVDVNKFFQFENNFGKFQKNIEESTIGHLAFWSNLNSQRASKKKVIEDGMAISQKVQQTKDLYQKLIEINPSNLHCLIIYANYMKIIVNNPQIYQKNTEAIRVIKRNLSNSSKLANDSQKQKYGDNAVTGVIILSGQRSNIGVIKHCNSKITQLIKYSPHQLLGQNVNILMPKFIGSMHDDILMSYLELTQSKHDNNERLAPMIDKDNYLVFVRILTKPLPSLFNGLQLIGAFNLVTQSHIDHPGEVPKYVLYRTDSGQVQALSESCDIEFNYRINKIDQNHQTSSELTFNSLFAGVKDSALNSADKSVKSKVKLAIQDSDHNQVTVQVYLRHQIFYFGVKLKLLYFFTLKTFKNLNQSEKDPQTGSVFKKIMVQQQQVQGLKTLQAPKQNDTGKQKKIRQLMRKKNNTQYQPLSLKVLSRFGYFWHLVFIIIVIILLVIDLSSNSYLDDFLQFSKLNLQSEGQILEINYFSRMKHLSYFYPNQLKDFDYYSKNISSLGSQLQKNQFAIVQYALKADNNGLNYNKYPYSWTMNQNLETSKAAKTLDVNVFDYITGASHFVSSQKANLNFPLKMLTTPTNTPDYIQLFHLRYTGLYQTIPNKIAYYSNSNDYFSNFKGKTLKNGSLQFGLICGAISIMLLIFVPLILWLQRFITQTIMLFGHMNTFEIQKQVANCNVFLEIFFKDSYRVKLNSKNKSNEFDRTSSFGADDIKLNKLKSQKNSQPSSVFGKDGKQKGFDSSNSQFEIDGQRHRRGSILQSAQKIQALQQQFYDRTQHQIQVTHNQFQQQKQQMLVKNNYQDQESIYQKLQKTKDNSKFKFVLVLVFIAIIFFSYFITRFFVNKGEIQKNHKDIMNIKMIAQNLNLMKRVKLYGIETVIDNSKFQNYSLPSYITVKYVNQLYEHQRRYNSYIYPESANLANLLGNDKISTLVKQSLCDKNNMDIYLSIVNLNNFYPKAAYSVSECQSIQSGILKQGFRPSLIAFTEILYNYTQVAHTVDQMVPSQKFNSILKMQKYLQGIQLFYLQKLQNNILTNLSNFKNTQVIICVIMVLIIIGLLLLVWWPLMKNTYVKISSTTQLLGLIPIRIFLKNTKLTNQYEKYISQMME